jgi:membrane protease YdiL (CAAX protease family)
VDVVVIGSAGVLAPGKWRWLRALGWMAVLTVAIVLAFNLVVKAALFAFGPAGEGATAKLVAAFAGSVAILLIYLAATRFGERRPVPELGLRPMPFDLLSGVAIGAAALSVIVGALWAFGWVVIESKPIDGIALGLRDSIRSGVLEELVLRLVVFRLLWRAFGIWPAILLASLFFGALHLANPDSSLFAAAYLIAGEGIGIGLYLLTGRIWAPIGMHAAWNFTQGWVFGAAVSGTEEIAGGPLSTQPAAGVANLLSGGGFGPEASLAALVVSIAASAAFLRWAWKQGAFNAAGDKPGRAWVRTQPSG